MKASSPLRRLAAVETCLACIPAPSPLTTLEVIERWLSTTSAALRDAEVAEIGLVAVSQSAVQLMMGGPLLRKDSGRSLPYRERLTSARSLQAEIHQALSIARNRLLQRVAQFEQTAEAGIRAAADAKLLSAPSGPRHAWVSDMATRMADHPRSAPHIARLGLALPGPDLLTVLDRVFLRVFGV